MMDVKVINGITFVYEYPRPRPHRYSIRTICGVVNDFVDNLPRNLKRRVRQNPHNLPNDILKEVESYGFRLHKDFVKEVEDIHELFEKV